MLSFTDLTIFAFTDLSMLAFTDLSMLVFKECTMLAFTDLKFASDNLTGEDEMVLNLAFIYVSVFTTFVWWFAEMYLIALKGLTREASGFNNGLEIVLNY